MTNRRGKLHQFTAVKLPAHGTDLADQLDELTRRRDQDHRERVAAEARLNQLSLEVQTLRSERDRAYRALEEAHQAASPSATCRATSTAWRAPPNTGTVRPAITCAGSASLRE